MGIYRQKRKCQKGAKMTLEDRATESLFKFLQSHVSELKVEDIDEIVLSYVVSILQDLTSGSYMDEEAFDVDAFCIHAPNRSHSTYRNHRMDVHLSQGSS